MQIIHPINTFFFTLFPSLEKRNEEEITTSLKKYYTYGPFVPKVTIQDQVIYVEVDTMAIVTQEADFNQAVSLCEKRDFQAATTVLKKLILRNPSNSEYHRILGQALSEQGKQDEAINALIDALRWDAKNGWALLMMGNIFARFKKDTTTALKYYDQAILANKVDHYTLSNIAYLLLQENKLEQAKKYANEALQIQPNYPNALFILGLMAERENASHTAFEYAILAVKQAAPTDPLYQNALQQAIEWARSLSEDFEGEKAMVAYRSQLEAEGGTEIEIEKDDNIAVVAKMEFAERYNRKHHLVKYKSNYPAVAHLVMHEMVHLDFVIQARKVNHNQLFLSTQQNKNTFLEGMQPAIKKLKNKGLPQENIQKFTEGVFNGLNLQTFNTPIDLFIEEFLFKKYEKLRPYQFLSLNRLMQDAIASVTDKMILEIVPADIVSKSKIYSLVNALQFQDLYGINLIDKFQASEAELEQAQYFFKEFNDLKNKRQPAEEYLLVKQWAKALDLNNNFELENEKQYEAKSNIDTFLSQLEKDPFGLETPEDPLQQKEMELFQQNQQAEGTNSAVVMYIVSALQFFKNKSQDQIKTIAFEIAMLGTMGIDPNKKDYIIGNIPEKRFSGTQVLAYYYTSWRLAIPEHLAELGLDYGKEFEMAMKLA
ncbi:tetratricopeptide repeat protein [Flavobacterium sp. TSSA_36]|uniref:tetratricopeptide repeat protein n=1 Tax=Flavobacterium sp. TSSA_36 TaxID=3447669 RepID=UPI003F384895